MPARRASKKRALKVPPRLQRIDRCPKTPRETLQVEVEKNLPAGIRIKQKEIFPMKKCSSLFMVIFLFNIVLVFACSEKKESETKMTAKEVQKAAQEAVEKALTYTQQQKEAYQKQIEGKIKEYDRKLEELKSRAGKMEKEAKKDASKAIEELQGKQETLSQKLEELKKATGQGWEDLKSGMDKAAEDLAKAYAEFISRFNK